MDNTIKIVRGTTNAYDIPLKEEESGAFYLLGEGEVLHFGVKIGTHRKDYELFKELTTEDINEAGDAYTVRFDPADTENMDFGEYCYDIGLKSGNHYYMVVECSKFILTHNVTTRRGNRET